MKILIQNDTITQNTVVMNRWCINVKTSKASILH